MIGPSFYFAALAFVAPTETDCEAEIDRVEYHLIDVCDPILSGEEAYAVTYRASLSPKPASQQVVVYTLDGEWFLRIAGYGWQGDRVETRRRDMPISSDDAMAITGKASPSNIRRLNKSPFYGEPERICMDGASLNLDGAVGGKRYGAAQHTCAGSTELFGLASDFRALALKYDPASLGFLYGLAVD